MRAQLQQIISFAGLMCSMGDTGESPTTWEGSLPRHSSSLRKGQVIAANFTLDHDLELVVATKVWMTSNQISLVVSSTVSN
jgi:hypothetical protein